MDQESQIPLTPSPQTTPPTPLVPTPDNRPKIVSSHPSSLKKILICLVIIIIILIGFFTYKALKVNKTPVSSTKITIHHSSSTKTAAISIPQSIDPINPSAIPLGDGKLSSSPEIGYVDSCITNFPASGGATADGPWINQANKTWDSTTKIAVEGSVSWPNASYQMVLSGASRTITGNDLPIDHTTGTFPIAKTDPAYTYDQNPNTITAQSISWTLPANPAAASSPQCTSGGPVGILNDGVLLFNALDGEGRDAGAHEILDSYQGHPDQGGMYHHHVIPTFMIGTSADKSTSTLIGYAADGYGIYVERDKMTDIYHYDATIEYPYSIGCFHGTPIKT